MTLQEPTPLPMMIGSNGYCDLILSITDNGLKLLDATGVKSLIPRTKELERTNTGVMMKHKITNDQASFVAMWHLSEIYGITININPEGTNMTSKRVQMTDECLEKMCSVFIVYEKKHLIDERKTFWNKQLVLGNLLMRKFDKWNAWRTITAMFIMNYYPPLQLTLLSNVTQIDSAIDFAEAERIYNIVNNKNLGTVQGYKK